MLHRYVTNWPEVLGIYFGLLSTGEAKFRDGEKLPLSKTKHEKFYEGLYRRYNSANGFIYTLRDGECVVETPNGLKLRLIDGAYSHVLDEVFAMRVYGKRDLSGREVVDVGASIADCSLDFALSGASVVFGFEPDPERFRIALENVRLNQQGEKIRMFNRRMTGGLGPSSLSFFLDSNDLRDVFLKIDCEGCEYDLIGNTPDTSFERISDIAVEYHRNPRPIVTRLRTLGFSAETKGEIIEARRT